MTERRDQFGAFVDRAGEAPDLAVAGVGFAVFFVIDAAFNVLPFASAPASGIAGAILFLSVKMWWSSRSAAAPDREVAAETASPAEAPPRPTAAQPPAHGDGANPLD